MSKTKTIPTEKEKSAEKAPKSKKVSAFGIYKGNKLIRVYSEEIHGEEFEKLAKEFIKGHEGYTSAPYEAPAPVSEEPKEEKDVVKIFHPSGDLHRIYSLSLHGNDYKKMAEQYLKKYPNKGYRVK